MPFVERVTDLFERSFSEINSGGHGNKKGRKEKESSKRKRKGKKCYTVSQTYPPRLSRDESVKSS